MKVAVILLLALAAVAQARDLTQSSYHDGKYGYDTYYSEYAPIYCKKGYSKNYKYTYYEDNHYDYGYGHDRKDYREYNAYDYYGYDKCPYGYDCAPLYKPVCKKEKVCHYNNYHKQECKYETVCWYHKCVEQARYCDPYAKYDECEKYYGYGYECKPYNYGHHNYKKDCKKEKYCKKYTPSYGYDNRDYYGYYGYHNDKCYEYGYHQMCYYNGEKYWQGMCEKVHHKKQHYTPSHKGHDTYEHDSYGSYGSGSGSSSGAHYGK